MRNLKLQPTHLLSFCRLTGAHARRTRRTVAHGLVLGWAAFGLAGCASGDRPDILAIATAGTGGVYYLLGGSMAEQWSRRLPAYNFVAEVTGGSVENLTLLMRDEVAVAFSMGTNALQAFEATGPFAGREAGQVAALAALYPNLLHVVTLQGSDIVALSDLAGRRVSVGAPGSGTEVAARTVLEANGIGYDAFRPQRLNFNETASALRDGNLDAGFLSVGPPTSSLMELASARPIRFVPIQEHEARRAIALDPTLRPDVLVAGTYTGHDEDVRTLSTPNVLVVRADLPDELAYELLRALLEGLDGLAGVHPAAGHLSTEYILDASPIPLHPGSAQYLRESGHELPDRLSFTP